MQVGQADIVLKLEGVSAGYEGIDVIHDIDVELQRGSIATLLGANGSGKSTLLKVISGIVKPSRGKIRFEGEDITSYPPDRIVAKRIIQCPENRQIFPYLTVLENLRIGAYSRKDSRQVKEDLEKVLALFPRLRERLSQNGGTLSGGEQQMLAIGRALMANPKVLLLDEPSLGLAPIIVREIFEIIRDINKGGTSILLVEQNANLALQISEYAYVMENGRIALSGESRELRQNDKVKELYLGVTS